MLQITDPDTGALVDAVDDRLLEDMEVLAGLSENPDMPLPDTLSFVPAEKIDPRCVVPLYYDHRSTDQFRHAARPAIRCLRASPTRRCKTSQAMVRSSSAEAMGRPSQEQRFGDVPYIKVSDLRAGHVNINPTNQVPRAVAEHFWHGTDSGLRAFDLISPERTSKNIGDFCVLMPGQEQVLTTKEIIVLRAGPKANFDQFYLLWAMTLTIVREQWKRVIFMQTNREDVGKRYLEIVIPVPNSEDEGITVSSAFRDYYTTIATARKHLQMYLNADERHHFFISGAKA